MGKCKQCGTTFEKENEQAYNHGFNDAVKEMLKKIAEVSE